MEIFFGLSIVVLLFVFFYQSPHHDNVINQMNKEYDFNITKLHWSPDKPFANFLRDHHFPLVIQNSIASNYPRWRIDDIKKITNHNRIQNVYSSNNAYFGPFYDENKPLHNIGKIKNPHNYQINTSILTSSIQNIFSSSGPPYYSLSVSLSDLNSQLENKMDLTELILLSPEKSSVNIWIGMVGGTTPCHYDGYYNM